MTFCDLDLDLSKIYFIAFKSELNYNKAHIFLPVKSFKRSDIINSELNWIHDSAILNKLWNSPNLVQLF